ncbi:ATP-dependent RNA helicase DHX8 [Ceratobasidium sp. AG-Ba]|nr:ATP-dependent RNA helicase DHX8 [Ceratobasidium sp. AG-Ba]
MSKVQLYVYDLSGGLAKALSLQMTGKQIDGIWHTSVVVFGKEIFYGQGIAITLPGRSHHGQPLQIIEFGDTAIDEETFNEYLTEIRQQYTADKYHLLDLPADFLSTPFGASLRPTIDNMFRRPTPGTTPPITQTPTQVPPPTDISELLLQAVAQRAATGSGAPSQAPPATASAASAVAGPVHISTNLASLNSLINTHKATIVFFTLTNCGPCRVIEPAFEDNAKEKGGADVAFVKVSLDGMGGQGVAAHYQVRATPTFLFFSNGKKTDELKGVDRHELKNKIDLLLYQVFPPHAHVSLELPGLKRLSTQPTVYDQVPETSKLLAKLQSTCQQLNIAGADTPFNVIADAVRRKSKEIPSNQVFEQFIKASNAFLDGARPHDLFPLLDLWRLALLIEGFATRCNLDIVGLANLIEKVSAHLHQLGPSPPKALPLTCLRLQSNISANSALFRQLLQTAESRSSFTQIMVSGLLHEDSSVRTAASTLAFNVGAYLQRSRRQSASNPDPVEDGDWEVEVLTAVLESLSKESDAGVVHRLVSAFGFIVLLSPWYSEQSGPLLEVLEAKKILDSVVKSAKGTDVQKLAKECVTLCGLIQM